MLHENPSQSILRGIFRRWCIKKCDNYTFVALFAVVYSREQLYRHHLSVFLVEIRASDATSVQNIRKRKPPEGFPRVNRKERFRAEVYGKNR